MAIKITCDECFVDFTVKDEAAGKKVKCKSCGAGIVVPVKKKQSRDVDDDWEEAPPPRTARRSASRKNASRSGSEGVPRWVWGVAGGGAGVLLLFGAILIFSGGKAKNGAPAGPDANPAGTAATGANPASAPGASIAWSVQSDPAAEKIDWPVEISPAMTVTEKYPRIAFPARPSRFVITNLGGLGVRGLPTVWDILTGTKKGVLKTATGDADDFVLSPDGRYLIVMPMSYKKELPALWSVETGDKVSLGSDLTGKVLGAQFAGADQALFWTKEKKLFVVDAKTGKVLRSADAIEPDQNSALVVSPGSKYVALGGTKGQIQIFDVATAKPAGETSYPGDLKNRDVSNLAFSADGTRLASFVAELDQTTFLVSDAKSGRMDVAFSLPGHITLSTPKATAYKGPPLEWLDDDHGWLLYGMAVVEQKSKQIVWQFPYPEEEILPTPRRLAGSRVLALSGSAVSRELKAFEIPWAKIETVLTSINPEDALFGKGTKVRIELQLGALLNGGQPDPTKDLIDKALRKRLASQQIEVYDDDTSLALIKVEYSEKAGPDMEFRQSGRGAGAAAPATVIATTMGVVQISILSPDGAKSLFKHAFSASLPGLLFNVQPTAAALRDKMLVIMKAQLGSVSLPIFIPKDPNGMAVPGTTAVD